MEINEMNYEIYAIDYAEGRLTGAEAAAMDAFMSLHPELSDEIKEIAAVAVPLEPAVYSDKESLKRKKRGIVMLPMAFAVSSAACLVLAFGLVWMIDRHQYYGELLSSANSHIEIKEFKVATIRDEVDRDAQMSTFPMVVDNVFLPTYSEQDQVVKNLNEQEEHPSFDIRLSVIPATETPLVPIDDNDELQGQFPEDIVILQVDNEFVLPVTLEMQDLSTAGGEQLRIKLENEEDKMARRQLIKVGALSVFQEKLMPSGLVDLINN